VPMPPSNTKIRCANCRRSCSTRFTTPYPLYLSSHCYIDPYVKLPGHYVTITHTLGISSCG
jgi:hypothetical protein